MGKALDSLKAPAQLEMSGFCVLHAELRVFTDGFLNNLAFEAWCNDKQKPLEERIKELTGSNSFFIEKDASGIWMDLNICITRPTVPKIEERHPFPHR